MDDHAYNTYVMMYMLAGDQEITYYAKEFRIIATFIVTRITRPNILANNTQTRNNIVMITHDFSK